MRAALVLAGTLALGLGTTAPASADGIYFTESIGGASVDNELGNVISDTMRVKFSVGYRLSKSWAVEGFVGGDIGTQAHVQQPTYALRCVECGTGGGGGTFYPQPSSLTTIGVDVKYLRPVSEHFELYLRGSLGKGWLDNSDYEGRGFGVGAGAQLKGKVRALGFLFWPLFFVPYGPKVTGALFIDTGADFYRLHAHGNSIDGSINRITIGWAIGADF